MMINEQIETRLLQIAEELKKSYIRLAKLEMEVFEQKSLIDNIELNLMAFDPKKKIWGWPGSNDKQRDAMRLEAVSQSETWKENDYLLRDYVKQKKTLEAYIKSLEAARRAIEQIIVLRTSQ